MENLLSQLATAQEEVEKPFPKEAELTEKMERLAELNSLLNMDEKRNIRSTWHGGRYSGGGR